MGVILKWMTEAAAYEQAQRECVRLAKACHAMAKVCDRKRHSEREPQVDPETEWEVHREVREAFSRVTLYARDLHWEPDEEYIDEERARLLEQQEKAKEREGKQKRWEL